MNAVIALLGGVRATIFAGVALALLIAAGVQTWRLREAHEDVEHWQLASAAAQEAIATHVQTITDLRGANREWANLAAQKTKEAAAAADALARERDARARELAERRRDRGRTYETDPEAAAWGRTRVPDRIAARLRE